jgi:hypothetical protein
MGSIMGSQKIMRSDYGSNISAEASLMLTIQKAKFHEIDAINFCLSLASKQLGSLPLLNPTHDILLGNAPINSGF